MDTQFEELLKLHFPDIYALHQLGKSEAHLWELLALIQQMRTLDVTGRIEIFYTRGHIDRVLQTTDVIAFKASRPGY